MAQLRQENETLQHKLRESKEQCVEQEGHLRVAKMNLETAEKQSCHQMAEVRWSHNVPASHTIILLLLLGFKAVFHTLLGSPYVVLWHSISFCRGHLGGQLPADVHVGRQIVLPGLPRLVSLQFSAGLSFFLRNTTHPPDHPHLRPIHLSLWTALPSQPMTRTRTTSSSNACRVNLALTAHDSHPYNKLF